MTPLEKQLFQALLLAARLLNVGLIEIDGGPAIQINSALNAAREAAKK